jgi:FMN phosphatase YigB (HAD superfamily)
LLTYLFVDLDHTVMRNPFQGFVFPPIATELAAKTGLEASIIVDLLVQENENRLQSQTLPAEMIMDWDDIVQVVAARLNVTCDVAPLALVQTHAAPPHTQVLDGSYVVLDELARPAHRRVIASTMGLSKYQVPVLTALGLDRCFSDVLAPDICQYLKTDPRFFRKYSTSDGLFITIGDNYHDDVDAPRRFGFHAIWVPRVDDKRLVREQLADLSPFIRWDHIDPLAGLTVRPDAIALSLYELPAIVSQIENGIFQ